jgi:midasin (ATPase involved in ribosome maturation)
VSQLQRGSGEASAPVFAFVEGALVSALRDGSWLLLDEINLAPNETLERLAGVLEVCFYFIESGSVVACTKPPLLILAGTTRQRHAH